MKMEQTVIHKILCTAVEGCVGLANVSTLSLCTVVRVKHRLFVVDGENVFMESDLYGAYWQTGYQFTHEGMDYSFMATPDNSYYLN